MKKLIVLPIVLLSILLIVAAVACSSTQDTYCSSGCKTSQLGDGVCQSACNNAACYYDNGDCGSAPTSTPIPTLTYSQCSTGYSPAVNNPSICCRNGYPFYWSSDGQCYTQAKSTVKFGDSCTTTEGYNGLISSEGDCIYCSQEGDSDSGDSGDGGAVIYHPQSLSESKPYLYPLNDCCSNGIDGVYCCTEGKSGCGITYPDFRAFGSVCLGPDNEVGRVGSNGVCLVCPTGSIGSMYTTKLNACCGNAGGGLYCCVEGDTGCIGKSYGDTCSQNGLFGVTGTDGLCYNCPSGYSPSSYLMNNCCDSANGAGIHCCQNSCAY